MFPAEVPGNVQYDYYVYKGWNDYQYSDNYKVFERVEDDTWRYVTKLQYSRKEGESVWFHADGIDYSCGIFVNGQLLKEHTGSFSRIDLDLTSCLTGEEDELSVVIHPHPKREDAPVGRAQADQVCKAPVCYGWAWHPRLLISGIWQDAYIETRGCSYISEPSVTYTLSQDYRSADVSFSFECLGEVLISLYDNEGQLVYKGSDRNVHLDEVKLWWCNEQGDPALYRWEMESADDVKSGRIGFRKSRLLMNEGSWNEPSVFPKSRSDAPATYELNGRKIFLKGSNFLTPDIFTGRVTEETYLKQITLAKEAHMNIFRCWGGCGCQKEAFYNLCDELGIMVWVEFPLACNLYAESDDYLQVLEKEATDILLRLREHPSVAFWCGGNELFNAWSGMTEQHLALRLLDCLCYTYDRGRPFLMTSPLNGMGHGNYLFYEFSAGEDNLATFRRARNTCYTEFGTPSLGTMEAVEKVIPQEDRVFPIPRDNAAWTAHYGTANDPWRCQSDMLKCFPECKTLEEALEFAQLMQNTSYHCVFEEARRQWPHCSMAVNWCYNEPWYSVVNRNIIDYDSEPLPAYYAVKDALRPVLATAGIPKFTWKAGEVFTADIVLHNDTLETIEREVTVTIRIGDESYELLDWKGTCLPMSNMLAPTVRFKLPNLGGEKLLELILTMNDGTVNQYSLRYFAKAGTSKMRRLNE